MAYSKQTWSSNELITADKLNHIEDGIPTKTSQLSNDSGFLTSHQSIAGKKNTQSAVSSPSANGTAVAFIDTISQDAQGVISPTKKTVATATTSAAGLMSADDKTKLNGIASGATANVGTVTSVATGVGLAGGTITGSGTLKAKLRSETALTIDSAAATTTSGRVYPVAADKSGYLAVNVPWANDNTTYSAGTGLSLSGTTFSNSGVTGVKGNSESSYRTGNVNITAANIGAAASNTVIADSTARTISEGTSSAYNVTGLTTDHVVAAWRFSGGYSENNPPADITVTTANGSYTIQASNLLTSGITMQPVFIKP